MINYYLLIQSFSLTMDANTEKNIEIISDQILNSVIPQLLIISQLI